MERGKIVAWIVALVALMSLVNAVPEKIYVVNLRYDKGDISLIDVYVKNGYAPGRKIQPEIGYSCETISFTNEELYSFKFKPPLRWSYDYLDPETGELSGGVIELEEVDFTLIIPYFPNGKEIDVYNFDGIKILEIDISQFSEVSEGYNIYLLVALALVISGAIIFWKYKISKRKGKVNNIKANEKVMELIREKLKEGENPEVLKKGLIAEGYDPNLVDEVMKDE